MLICVEKEACGVVFFIVEELSAAETDVAIWLDASIDVEEEEICDGFVVDVAVFKEVDVVGVVDIKSVELSFAVDVAVFKEVDVVGVVDIKSVLLSVQFFYNFTQKVLFDITLPPTKIDF